MGARSCYSVGVWRVNKAQEDLAEFDVGKTEALREGDRHPPGPVKMLTLIIFLIAMFWGVCRKRGLVKAEELLLELREYCFAYGRNFRPWICLCGRTCKKIKSWIEVKGLGKA